MTNSLATIHSHPNTKIMYRLSLISLTTILMTALTGINANAEQFNTSGTAYGLAVTYDFAFPNSKISAYAGPRLLFASGSGQLNNFSINTNETHIGLIAGADYAISEQFTAGLNVTYDFSVSGSNSYNQIGTTNNGNFPVSSGGFNLGVNLGYSF